MSKLNYNEDNNGDGWNDDFGEEIDLDDPIINEETVDNPSNNQTELHSNSEAADSGDVLDNISEDDPTEEVTMETVAEPIPEHTDDPVKGSGQDILESSSPPPIATVDGNLAFLTFHFILIVFFQQWQLKQMEMIFHPHLQPLLNR